VSLNTFLFARMLTCDSSHSIWSNALAAGLKDAEAANSSGWSRALAHALATLYQYTAARSPSRTLIDPLSAFTDHFSSSGGQDFTGAVAAALSAAERTRDIEAKAGRAAYVGQEALKEANVPDPGAWGVVKILRVFRRRWWVKDRRV
jgi:dihydroxyacetone kinase